MTQRVRSRSAGRNLKSFNQIRHRRVETTCDDLQCDNSRIALATFNVRQGIPCSCRDGRRDHLRVALARS